MFSVNTTAAVILLRNRIWMICCPKDLCCELFCMIGNQRIFILSATFTQKLENFVWVITGKYLSHVFFDGHLLPLFGGSGSTALWAATGKPARRPAVASTMTTKVCGLHLLSPSYSCNVTGRSSSVKQKVSLLSPTLESQPIQDTLGASIPKRSDLQRIQQDQRSQLA